MRTIVTPSSWAPGTFFVTCIDSSERCFSELGEVTQRPRSGRKTSNEGSGIECMKASNAPGPIGGGVRAGAAGRG